MNEEVAQSVGLSRCPKKPIAVIEEVLVEEEVTIEDLFYELVNRKKKDTCMFPGSSKKINSVVLVGGDEALKCPVPYCDYSCTRKSDLNRHSQIHTTDKMRQINYCSNSFDFSSIKLSHPAKPSTPKPEKPKPFKCPSCNYRCAKKSALTEHNRVHTGEKPFVCTVPSCGSRYARKSDLKQHTRIHTGAMWLCHHCYYRTVRKACLERHLRIHNMDPNDLVYCNECSYKTIRKSDLTRHIRTHTKKRDQAENSEKSVYSEN